MPGNEPIVEDSQEVTKKEEDEGCCGIGWTCEDVAKCCCDAEKGTCLCWISCGDWAVILTLFTIYYCFLGLFYWGMIEAMFAVKKQGYPVDLHATHPN